MSAKRGHPQRDRLALKAVERMLMQHTPNGIILATIARKFGMSERTVSNYIADAWKRIEEAEEPERARRRTQTRITAQAACAKCLASSDRMHAEAVTLLAAAKRLDEGARQTLEDAIESGDAEDEDEDAPSDAPTVKVPPSVKRARAKMKLAHQYRSTAVGLLARAEVWNARAESWFDKVCRIAGTYVVDAEPDGRGGASSMRGLTSAQRRERVGGAVAKLREKLAARKAAVEAARQGKT